MLKVFNRWEEGNTEMGRGSESHRQKKNRGNSTKRLSKREKKRGKHQLKAYKEGEELP